MYHIFFIHSSVDEHSFRLLSCPSYCKKCSNKYWGACTFLNYGILQVNAREQDFQIIWQLYFQFFKEPPYSSPQWLYQFTFPQTVQEGSVSSAPTPEFIVCRLCDDGHSDWPRTVRYKVVLVPCSPSSQFREVVLHHRFDFRFSGVE